MLRRWMLVGLVIAGLLPSLIVAPLASVAPPAAPAESVPYIVALRPDMASASDVTAFAERFGVRPTRLYSSVFRGFAGSFSGAEVAAIGKTGAVLSIMPDLAAQMDGVVPMGVDRVGADDVDGSGGGPGAAATVAVIDTGVGPHPDLTVAGGYDCTSDDATAWADDNGHGTHVAGTIGANGGIVGIAPGTPILAIKVLGSDGFGSLSDILCGLDWLAGAGNGDAPRALYANMSIGARFTDDPTSCTSTPYHLAFCTLQERGVTVVVSAGNSGIDAALQVPASYDQVVTVSALNDTDGCAGGLGPSTGDGPDEARASFSNVGAVVDYAAPGTAIMSTYVGGGYVSLSGTSMASPHVAALLALGRLTTEPSGFGEPIAIITGGDRSCVDRDDDRTLPASTLVWGNIHDATDTDVYQFVGEAGQVIAAGVVTNGDDEPLDPVLTLKRPGGQTLASNDDYAGNVAFDVGMAAAIDAIELPVNGVYTLEVSANTGTGGLYYIVMDRDDEDGTTLTSATSLEGRIVPWHEADRFPFSATAGTTFSATMTRVGAVSLDPYLVLQRWDAGKETWRTVADDDDGGGDGAAMIAAYPVTQDGDYRLVALSYGGRTRGAYTLAFDLFSTSGTPTPAPPVALAASTVQAGRIARARTDAVFTYAAVAGERMVVGVSPDATAPKLDLEIEVRGPNGDVVATTSAIQIGGLGAKASTAATLDGWEVEASGTYEIRVRAGGAAVGSFAIAIYPDPEDGEAIPAGGSRLRGAIAPGWEYDVLLFEAAAGDEVGVAVTTAGESIDLAFDLYHYDEARGVWGFLFAVDDGPDSVDPAFAGVQFDVGGTFAIILWSWTPDIVAPYTVVLSLIVATPTPRATATPRATRTRAPTRTPRPTRTVAPTRAPRATRTPLPSATGRSSSTVVATRTRGATRTPRPTRTPRTSVTATPDFPPTAPPSPVP